MDVAQVYGSETPKMRFWRATRITEFRPDAVGGAEAVLVDAPSERLIGGTGRDIRLVYGATHRRTSDRGGRTRSHQRPGRDHASEPWGVDACSRLESSPGRKDHAKGSAIHQGRAAEA